jgi:hypothetical protein
MNTIENEMRDFFTNDRQKIYKKLIKKYGKNHQIMKCVEEISELNVELSKKINDNETENYPVEVIDTKIMIEQMIMLFKIEVPKIKKDCFNIDIIKSGLIVQKLLIYVMENRKVPKKLETILSDYYSMILRLDDDIEDKRIMFSKLKRAGALVGMIYS